MTKSRHSIVLTGGPGSGKTETLKYLRTFEPLADFAFLEELARMLLESNPDYRQNWHQLHLDIYRQQTERETALGEQSFITDRGTVDAFAFHPETAKAVNTTINKEYDRYSLVIQLETSARLGEQFYQTDSIRNEPIEKAIRIENAIRSVWENHPNYHFVRAETDLETKRKKVVALISRYAELL